MKLEDLMVKVREENLTKDQLEGYHKELSEFYAMLMLETAELEKEEAQFMAKKMPEDSVAQMKVWWKATPSGQRLIVLKRYALAAKTLLGSLKSRLYLLY